MISRSILPVPTHPGSTIATSNTTLIDRYTGRYDHAGSLRYELPDQFSLDLTLWDTSHIANGGPLLPPDSSSLWHVIWVRHEDAATVTVVAETAEKTWPIAPGDSLLVPPGASLATTGGHLALTASAPGQASRPVSPGPPTHGEDQFAGHNRRTTYPSLPGAVAARWKITQPLDLSLSHPAPFIVFSLAGDPAIATATESTILRRGRAVLIQGNQPVTMYPDGLAYVVVIDQLLP